MSFQKLQAKNFLQSHHLRKLQVIVQPIWKKPIFGHDLGSHILKELGCLLVEFFVCDLYSKEVLQLELMLTILKARNMPTCQLQQLVDWYADQYIASQPSSECPKLAGNLIFKS